MRRNYLTRIRNSVRLVARFCDNDAGTTAITFAFCAITLSGAIGLAVDSAVWHKTRTELASAADAAALAAASAFANARTSDNTSEGISLAIQTAQRFVTAELGQGFTPDVTVDDASGRVAVRLAHPGKSMLTQVLGTTDIMINVVSEAIAGVDSNAQACIIALDPDAPIGIDFSLGGQVVAHDCAIWSNATSTTSIDANGGGFVRATETCAVGEIARGSLDIQPAVRSNCAPVEDPLASWNAPLLGPCNFTDILLSSGPVTLTPGVYCGGIRANGSVQITMQPGLYILLNGGMRVNGGATITGVGVTIYTTGTDPSLDFLGSAGVQLSAPLSGPNAGLVFASNRTEPVVDSRIGGGSGIQLEGNIYLPNHNIGYGGNTDVSAPAGFTVVIGRTIKFHGGAQVEVRAVDTTGSTMPSYAGQVSLVGSTRLVR
jgi:Flp pilus assembly protein TadG